MNKSVIIPVFSHIRFAARLQSLVLFSIISFEVLIPMFRMWQSHYSRLSELLLSVSS